MADHAEIYNPSPIYLESHCIVSQDAYICGATHDYNHPDFPMVSYSMRLGAYSWICARASVSPGVNVGEGAVLGLGSVANRDLEPWTVYSGVPAVGVKARVKKRAYRLVTSVISRPQPRRLKTRKRVSFAVLSGGFDAGSPVILPIVFRLFAKDQTPCRGQLHIIPLATGAATHGYSPG